MLLTVGNKHQLETVDTLCHTFVERANYVCMCDMPRWQALAQYGLLVIRMLPAWGVLARAACNPQFNEDWDGFAEECITSDQLCQCLSLAMAFSFGAASVADPILIHGYLRPHVQNNPGNMICYRYMTVLLATTALMVVNPSATSDKIFQFASDPTVLVAQIGGIVESGLQLASALMLGTAPSALLELGARCCAEQAAWLGRCELVMELTIQHCLDTIWSWEVNLGPQFEAGSADVPHGGDLWLREQEGEEDSDRIRGETAGDKGETVGDKEGAELQEENSGAEEAGDEAPPPPEEGEAPPPPEDDDSGQHFNPSRIVSVVRSHVAQLRD